jgi:PAS domain S-box-containing protein
MIEKIQARLLPAYTDYPEQRWRQRLLNTVLLTLFITNILFGLVIAVVWAWNKAFLVTVGIVIVFGVPPVYLLAYWLGRHGRVRLAGYLTVSTLFIAMSGSTYLGGVGHVPLIGYALVTLAAGVLIGTRTAFGFALLSVGVHVAVGFAQATGQLPHALAPETTVIADASGLGLTLVVLVTFYWLSEREIKQALSRERELNIDLARSNEQAQRELAEHIRTQEALRESEDRFRAVFENAPIGIYRTTPDGQILMANSKLVKMLGYSSFEELVQRNLESSGYPPDYPRFSFKQQIEGEGQISGLESGWVKNDGSTIFVRENARVVWDESGNALYYEGTVEDITDCKQAQKVQEAVYRISEAAHNAKDLQSLFELIHTIICQLMPADNFYIALYDPETNMVSFPYYVDEHHSLMSEEEKDILVSKRPGKGMTEYVLRTGKPLLASSEMCEELERKGEIVIIGAMPVDWIGVPLKTGDTVFGVVAVQTYSENVRLKENDKDILIFVSNQIAMAIERKRAEAALMQQTQELARSNAELQQFAYIASHDLQEPLRMVTSYLQFLERRYKGSLDEDADDFIAFAVDGAKRMQAMISALLAYSRVGTRGKSFEPTDVSAILNNALANLVVTIEENDAMVTHDDLPTVMADDVQLTQLLQNLISNGIKFHRQDTRPEVHIGAKHAAGEWIFSVHDNGIGIDPQYFERIFQIFQRLHTREEYEGTGIGLAMCQKIVERHGGRIWGESKPREGSTFYFTLPDKEVT